MANCIFCSIIEGNIPSTKVYEDEQCVAFRDIAPQAPQHIVLIPRRHIASIDALTPDDAALAGHMMAVVPVIAASCGLSRGYRVVTNVGEHGAQTVQHLHFHIIGGAQLGEKLA